MDTVNYLKQRLDYFPVFSICYAAGAAENSRQTAP